MLLFQRCVIGNTSKRKMCIEWHIAFQLLLPSYFFHTIMMPIITVSKSNLILVKFKLTANKMSTFASVWNILDPWIFDVLHLILNLFSKVVFNHTLQYQLFGTRDIAMFSEQVQLTVTWSAVQFFMNRFHVEFFYFIFLFSWKLWTCHLVSVCLKVYQLCCRYATGWFLMLHAMWRCF